MRSNEMAGHPPKRGTRRRGVVAPVISMLMVGALTVPTLAATGAGPAAAPPPAAADVASVIELGDLIAGPVRGVSFDDGALTVAEVSDNGATLIEITPWGDLVGPNGVTDSVAAVASNGDGTVGLTADGTVTAGTDADVATGLTAVVDAAPDGAGGLLVLHDDGRSVTAVDTAGVTGDTVDVGHADAIAADASGAQVYLLDSSAPRLSIRDQDLAELGQVDLTGLISDRAASMTVGASADNTDPASENSLYVLEPAGASASAQLTELSLIDAAGANAAETVASPVPLQVTHTRVLSTLNPPSPDSAGVTFLSNRGSLLVSDSEVNETPLYQGVNLFEIPTDASSLLATGNTLNYSDEPTGLSHNPATNTLYISDDVDDEIFMVQPGTDTIFGTNDDIVDSFDTKDFNSNDPEGVAFDKNSGALFVVDGVNKEVYRVQPNSNGFDGMPVAGGDDTVTQFDTEVLGARDPEGIEFDPTRNRVMVLDHKSDSIYELTSTGTHLETLEIDSANPDVAAGLARGPSSSGMGFSLYVVDRGVDNNSDPNENDGKMYEFAFNPNPVVVPGSVLLDEGSGGGTQTAAVPFTLSGPSPYPVTIDWATFDYTGSPGLIALSTNDFTAASGTLTFPPYTTTVYANVEVNQDNNPENNEYLLVRSFNHVNGRPGGLYGLGVAVIFDDD